MADEETKFAPWGKGSAQHVRKTGVITATLPLKEQWGHLRATDAEIHGDGQFLTVTFEGARPEDFD